MGLPNVGKSTLFNCLSNTKAQSANFPFCTIDPNIGLVNIPDKRLNKLVELVGPEKIVPNSVEIVDIAGLVKGASKGEGLGNQFLSNIRETNAIIHVLRCYHDENITHVEGSVDPLRDKEIIDFELKFETNGCEKIILKLASWRPGRYELANYAQYIQKWSAFSIKGKRLKFKKIDKKADKSPTNCLITMFAYWFKRIFITIFL